MTPFSMSTASYEVEYKAMSITQSNYHITKGLPWERLVIVKDRRTHRVLMPTDAWATIKTSNNTKKTVPLYITSEGGIMLYLSAEETRELPEGELPYDVVAVLTQRSALAGGGWTSVTTPVATGTVLVSSVDLASSLGDSTYMELTLKKGADFRLTLSWLGSDGAVLSITDAYMQAKNSTGTVVVDLRWFATTPSETTILSQTGPRRGYLAPFTGESLEMHISDMNTVTAGTYPYDIFVKGSVNDDWVFLAGGNLIVESTISVKPS